MLKLPLEMNAKPENNNLLTSRSNNTLLAIEQMQQILIYVNSS
jgi:hypothetical protein